MNTIEKIGKIIPEGNSVVEIEMRFAIDNRKRYDTQCKMYDLQQTIKLVKEIITKYSDKQSLITQSINFINGDKIKQMIFKDGVQQPKKLHYKKQQIIQPIFLIHNTLPAYRLMCNFETPIDEFSVSDAKMARIRLRYTISLTKWQIDITLVKNVDNLNTATELKTSKTKMFFKITDFIKEAPWEYADFIELEAEFTGKNFTSSDLLFGNTMFENTFVYNLQGESAASTKNIESGENAVNIDNNYQNAIYTVAKLIRPRDYYKFQQKFGINQLSNRVVGLDKNIFLNEVLNKITNYYLTDKTDGVRTIIHINNKSVNFINDKLTTETIKTDNVYVLDAEHYKDTYYIFDIMVYEGRLITNYPFKKRLEYFNEVSKLSPNFKPKIFIKLTDNFQKDIKNYKGYDYETDGYILNPADGHYDDMIVYKYKPIERMSIDMMLKKCPDKLLGISPYKKKTGYTLYILFSGVNDRMFRQLRMDFIKYYQEMFPAINKHNLPQYFPIQFCPGDFAYAHLYWDKRDNLDNEVGEFICKGCIKDCDKLLDMITRCTNIWELQHIRDDRKVEIARGNYFGNDIKNADKTWMNYKDPLIIEELSSNGYFQEHDNPIQKATRNFHSYVKSEIFKSFKGTDYTIDLASGKGQDLLRYSKYEFKNVVFLEIDTVALLELTSRKYDLLQKNKGYLKPHPINIKSHQLDLNDNYKTNIERLSDIDVREKSADIIMCNFAFHYLIKNRASIINIAKFINHYVRPGGRFIFTAFDANDVIRLLNAHRGEWTVYEDDQLKINKSKNNADTRTIKHSIKRQYETSVVEQVGQQIEVILPFSKTEYYKEYLVNIAFIEKEFEKFGFKLEINQSFGEYLDTYNRDNKNGFDIMTDNDKILSSLYHYYCFYKKIN